ncbi:MAG: BON domain-containing protein [Candidatus Dojkabacteria bacterium]|jgi:osmotically-inducible protein OsmY|nr:BON domain-containing protein [Candidatus Dojkabacteria bacterium]
MKTLDEDIKKMATDSLYQDTRIDSSEIKLLVNQGKVTLTGEVNSGFQKRSAGEVVCLIPGVIEVNNMISVRTKSSINDEDLENRVRTSLILNSNIDITELEVTARNGEITLEGKVDTYWRKERAENIVEDVEGVKGVKNRLVMVHTDKITDEIIGGEIMKTLRRVHVVNPDHVNVNVKNGKVIFSGEVRSLIERNSAYEAALYTNGVNEIKDNLKVITE